MLKTVTIGMSILTLFLLSPMFVFCVQDKKRKQHPSATQMKLNDRFEIPKKLWMLTLQGISMSICCFAMTYLLMLFFAVQICHIHWATFMIVFAVYWFTMTLIIPTIEFNEHENDYVSLRDGQLKCKLRGEVFDIPCMCLQKVVKRRGAIVLTTKNNMKLCFPNNRILKFNSSEILIEQLEQLCAIS